MGDQKLAITSFIRQYFLVIFFALLGFTFIGIGLYQTLVPKVPAVVFEEGEIEEIVVDVSGAVIKPGVYVLESNMRMNDAVIAAGGLSADADREYIARSMNMASGLVDGQKVYIPIMGENEPVEIISEAVVSDNLVSSGLVGLNSGSQSELDSLPGVGPATIEKIVDGRPYTTVEELLSKDILGKATYEKVKDLVDTR